MEIIKRYESNRKMYSVRDSKYVKMGDIFKKAVAGEDFVIVDSVSRANITFDAVLKSILAARKSKKISGLECSKAVENSLNLYGRSLR